MAAPPGKRAAERNLWEQHRETIHRFYIEQNQTIDELQKLMAAPPYNLVKSKGQFERGLRNLNIKKYNARSEWKHIARKYAARQAIGKSSIVLVRNKRVSAQKLHREIQRHSYETTTERCTRIVNPRQHSMTPPYIDFHTPHTSPISTTCSPDQMDCEDEDDENFIIIHMQSPSDSSGHVYKLPWAEFERFIQSQANTCTTRPGFWDPLVANFFETDAYESESNFFIIPDNWWISTGNLLSDTIPPNQVMVQTIMDKLKAFIPKNMNGQGTSYMNVHVSADADSSKINPRHEFLSQAICLISNKNEYSSTNDIGYSLDYLLVDLLQYYQNRKVLDIMLSQNLPTVRAFAENILRTVLLKNDARLLTHFQNSGAFVQLADLYIKLIRNSYWFIQFDCFCSMLRKVSTWADDASAGNDAKDLYRYKRVMLEYAIIINNMDMLSIVFEIWPYKIKENDSCHQLGLLELTAQHGSRKMIKYLMERLEIDDNLHNQIYGKAVAAAGGQINTLNYLLSLGADVNTYRLWEQRYDFRIEKKISTALQEAAWANDTDAVHLLLSHGAVPDPEPPNEEVAGRWPTALQGAAYHGNLELVQWLLEAGADIGVVSTEQWGCIKDGSYHRFCGTALEAAVESGQIEVVLELLRTGASTNSRPADIRLGITLALKRACKQGRLDISRLLVKHGAAINIDVLIKAAESGVRPLMEWLLEQGADRTELQGAFLVGATTRGDIRMVQSLLDQDEAIENIVWGGYMWEAMQRAIENNNMPLVQALITNGAPIAGSTERCEHEDGLTFLKPHSQNAVGIARALVAAGAVGFDRPRWRSYFVMGKHAQHRMQATPLQEAASAGNLELVRFFLDQGASVNMPAVGWSGRTALQMAAWADSCETVDLLLAAGADVNAPPARESGVTALQAAAAHGNFAMVHSLLNANADVNAPRAFIQGLTALESAAASGRLDMARFLLHAGAHIAGPFNSQYRRAVGIAWLEGHHALAQDLQDYKERTFGITDCQLLDDILAAFDVTYWDDMDVYFTQGQEGSGSIDRQKILSDLGGGPYYPLTIYDTAASMVISGPSTAYSSQSSSSA